MSKYGLQLFINMKSCIFLILVILHIVFGSEISNLSDYDDLSVCPVTLFRRKRAINDYTRWKSNVETTPQFIVKVMDEEMTTVSLNPVVAVNIQPVTKRGEKIIVGGAMVPPPTPMTSTELPRDYTRFVPPTTVPVTRFDGDLYLAPVPAPVERDGHPPVKPKPKIKNDFVPLNILHDSRHVLRDESPPASPQFLPHSPLAPIAQQYAPIEPVAFTRRYTSTPLTPPFSEPTEAAPTRTTESDFVIPVRTVQEDIPVFHPFTDDDYHHDFLLTRSTLGEVPDRTRFEVPTELQFHDDNEEVKTSTNYLESRRNHLLSSKHGRNKYDDKTDVHREVGYGKFEYHDYNKGAKDRDMPIDFYDDKEKERADNDIFENEDSVDRNHSSENENGTDSEYHYDSSSDDSDTNTTRSFPNNETVETGNMDKSKRRSKCSLLKLRTLNFNSPRILPEIVAQLKQWAEESPVARWVDITDGNLTTMENPIYMMIVDDPSSGQIASAKQTVMVVSGIQGRDHHAVAAAMYLLYQLIERSEAHTDLLTKYRFWIIPVFNPDGYDYSMTFPHRQEWTKNLRQNWDNCKTRESCRTCTAYGLRCTIQPCYGVNLDRNFEYQWIPAEELRSEHPCGALYAGSRQLSEVETRALTHFLHEQHTPLFTFIAFKEGDVLGVLYPYSHTRKRRAFDHVYRQRASRAASAAYSISGRPYVAGQTSEFLPLYAGGIEDWVDGHLGIDNTYTIMMFRPTDSYNSKLITERVVHEAYAAMDTLLLQSIEPLGPPVITHMARESKDSRLVPHTSLVCTMIIYCYLRM